MVHMGFETQIHIWMQVEADNVRFATGVDIHDLLMASLGRVLLNDARRAGKLDRARYNPGHIAHINDWLVSARMHNDAWLSRRDADGNIPKLAKFGSVDQIVAEADKAMRKRLNHAANVVVQEHGVIKVHDCGDGYAIYRLRTPEALDREGFAMGHCVGQGAYDLGLTNNMTAIFSLRDGFGKSHVTIEVDQAMGVVEQIKGKQNDLPKDEYMRRLIGWLDPDLEIKKSELPAGFAVDRKKGLVEIAAFKPGDTFDGDLLFKFDDAGMDIAVPLPADFTVTGMLSVDGGDLINRMSRAMDARNGMITPLRDYLPRLTLPSGLNVGSKLEIRACAVELDEFSASYLHLQACLLNRLPGRVSVDCAFDSTYTDGPLPAIVFHRDVALEKCSGFTFGEGTRFMRDLYVSISRKPSGETLAPAVSIGDGTSCDGSVHILRSDIEFKGAFSCASEMTLRKCGDVRMPDELCVGGNLTIEETFIDRWPTNLSVDGEQVYESVDSLEGLDSFPVGHVGGTAPKKSGMSF